MTDTELTPTQVKTRQALRASMARLEQSRAELPAKLATIDAQHEQRMAELDRQRAELAATTARTIALAESMVSPEQRRRNQDYARYVAARDARRRRADIGRCRCNSMWHWHPTPTWLRVLQWGFVAYLVGWSVVAWLAERLS